MAFRTGGRVFDKYATTFVAYGNRISEGRASEHVAECRTVASRTPGQAQAQAQARPKPQPKPKPQPQPHTKPKPKPNSRFALAASGEPAYPSVS